MASALCLVLGSLSPQGAFGADTAVSPLDCAHAHNDYEHTRPLLDALDQGFCSVEADVHLVDGQLLVAHDRRAVKPERTLQALYLDPLRARVEANRGQVHPNGPAFFLLIDFKSDGPQSWVVLRAILEGYRTLLTEFTATNTSRRAITVVISGNSPRDRMAAEPARLAAVDGRLPDLETNPSPHLVPWVSENWLRVFQWRGTGEFPSDEKERLRQITAKAHAQGRRVRFWGGPDIEPLWLEQRHAGADLINTDRLADLRTFLLGEPGKPHFP